MTDKEKDTADHIKKQRAKALRLTLPMRKLAGPPFCRVREPLEK